jgi:ribosomal protein S18 acetylase RimI-like enzyme
MEAFGDYYVDMGGVTEQVLFNRATKNGVAFELSVGAFDDERMVAVTIVGVDTWKGLKAAYDIGTGVIPGYRGQGIARAMFDFVWPKLRDRGVERFVLEVIQDNAPSIKAYKSTGFEVTREFDCFQWKPADNRVETEAVIPLQMRSVDRDYLNEFQEHLDWWPSWENSISSIQRIPDRVNAYGAFVDENRCVGLLVYYPLMNWITTLVVKRSIRKMGVATALLAHFTEQFADSLPMVKLANVERSDRATLNLLEKNGFELSVRQFEMELSL